MAADNKQIAQVSKNGIISLLLLLLGYGVMAQSAPTDDSMLLRRIYDESLLHSEAYHNLQELTTTIGERLTGTPQATQTIEWGRTLLKKAGADSVYLQKVWVPRWNRGKIASASVPYKDNTMQLNICALGGSIGTNGRLTAPVIEIRSWRQLDSLPAKDVRGKIVFFNRPMDPRIIEPFTAYLEAVDQRNTGAVAAARKGAIATIVRSLTLSKDDLPHTGAVSYDSSVAMIPAAAVSTNGADWLSKALIQKPELRLSLELDCQRLTDVASANVIAEIKGTVAPNEVVTIGAHIDSWDLSESASDDGAGLVQVIDALRILRTVLPHPARTIRIILYINEENGNRGGLQYAAWARQSREQHLAVFETDAGGFFPHGFRIDAAPEIMAIFKNRSTLFRPYKADGLTPQHRGVDIGPMKGIAKAVISLDCDDQRLFDIHHSAADTFDKVSKRELELGAAALAGMAALTSEHGLDVPAPFSNIRSARQTFFVAGQIGINEGRGKKTSFKEETTQALTNVQQALASAGLTLGDVVNVTVYLREIKQLNDFNEVYRTFFSAPYPARTLVQVDKLVKDAAVEISVVAGN
ncbi:Rid family hydrolase [Chitinophaga pinensis]|uniref:Carboxypeptidase Q n=1 Tax=Chitinophaga pinensis (strain ATCC 43595 / DSM 2588 / LMG 13176 / NBRC 15968 / NCIMB 11800 / UQM 2034) TaxID=485918 RepID=A0A979G8V8_CHIPD|nr:Rid family hydrolase [Chitinophaga pinensis]ACU63089.1 Endoribonuclease L-PSP [Chitinophaga pinensis DSM 2588]